MATRTISASGGTRAWSDTASWDEAAVPTASDDVIARGDGTSGALTIAANASCRSFVMTNYSNTLTFTAGVTWSVGTSTSGAFTLVPGMTFTTNAGTALLKFLSTTTGNNITTAGKTMCTTQFVGNGGGWQLQDTWNGSTITLRQGALDLNGQAVNLTSQFNTNNAGTRSLTTGVSTITFSASGITPWDFSTNTGCTLTMTGSTIVYQAAGTFAGGGFTYGAVTFPSTGTCTITGANTFTTLTTTSGGVAGLVLPASSTTTLTTWTANGIPGTIHTITSSSSGTAATVSIATGTTRLNHTSIKDVTATGGATFESYDSINVSGNTGVTFKKANKLALAGVA